MSRAALQWRQAFSRLVTDPDLRRGMGASARRTVERLYPIETVARDQVLPMLRQIATAERGE